MANQPPSDRNLKNISHRTPCPRCSGTGKSHSSQQKHDTKATCKKCTDCPICGGSGFVVGKVGCSICSARGFVHPKYAVSPHVYTISPERALVASVRCIDCIDCSECDGEGVFNSLESKGRAVPELSYIYQTFTAQPVVTCVEGIPIVNLVHPHLLAAIIPNYPTNVTERKLQMVSEALQSLILPTQPALKSRREATPCPICEGFGFKHTEACAARDTKKAKSASARCKFCTDCKSCKGLGTVGGTMVACYACNMQGFVHSGTAIHDAPPNLRCFFCANCSECKGTLLVTRVVDVVL